MNTNGNTFAESTIRSGERISLEKKFIVRFKKMLAVCDALLNCKQITVSENNLVINGLGSSSGVGSASIPFAITELGHSDFYVARQLSNLRLEATVPTFDVGATDFKIAKPTFVRRSITSEKLFGSTITYINAPGSDRDNNRIARDGVRPDEPQVVLAPYITLSDLGLAATVPAKSQCVVYAQNISGAAGVFDEEDAEITWLEVTNGARVFAKKYVS